MDAIDKAKLLDTRFDKVFAERGPRASISKGRLLLEVATKLVDLTDDKRQAIAQVQVDVTGMPAKESGPDDFAFKVSVVGSGLYDWPTLEARPNLDSNLILRLLCQPIHTLVISEVSGLARRMGVSGVVLPFALENHDHAPASKKPAESKSRLVAAKSKARPAKHK